MNSDQPRTPVAPPWMRQGGVGVADAGTYRRAVQALRPAAPISAVQSAQVIDLVMQARSEGRDVTALEPTAPPEVREPAFADLLRPAIAAGKISEVTLTDPETLRRLYRATLGWGDHVQPLLDDPDVTEVKIIGCTAVASSSRGQIVCPQAFADVREPLSRVQALVQLLGLVWDSANPSITAPLAYKTRLHATRPPLVPEGDLLLVVRRGRRRGWRLSDLVTRHALSPEAADLLQVLVQAGASVVIVGPQDSGKTTLLETLLHAVPTDRHLVLIEDATDELALEHPLLTRLQVQSSAETPVAVGFATVMREVLRMTPDVVAPTEVRGAEAGTVLQIAESGRPTLTTLHARSPLAGVRRLARLAAAEVPGNTFAGQMEAALQVVADAFHLIVQMEHVPRLGRRVVRGIWAFGDAGRDGCPTLVPLVEGVLDAQAPGGIRWTVAAQVEAAGLRMRDDRPLPAALGDLLQSGFRGPGARAVRAVTEAAATQVERLVAHAEAALDRGDQGQVVVDALTQALRLAPGYAPIWTVVERLMVRHPDLAQQALHRAQDLVARLQRAVERQDDAAGHAVRQAADEGDVLLRGVLARDPRWHDLVAKIDGMQTSGDAARTALATAYTRATTQRDLRGALESLRGCDPRTLPREVASEVVQARIGILTAILRRGDQVTAAEREMMTRQIEMMQQEAARLERMAQDPAPALPLPDRQAGDRPAGAGAGGADRAPAPTPAWADRPGGTSPPDGERASHPGPLPAAPPPPAGDGNEGFAWADWHRSAPPAGRDGPDTAPGGGLDLPDTAQLVVQVARSAIHAAAPAAPAGADRSPGTPPPALPRPLPAGPAGAGDGAGWADRLAGNHGSAAPGPDAPEGAPRSRSAPVEEPRSPPAPDGDETNGDRAAPPGAVSDPALPFRSTSSEDVGKVWRAMHEELRRRGPLHGREEERR